MDIFERGCFGYLPVTSFHPGGEKTLICRAGLEADDMFNSVHLGNFEVKSLLNELEVGYLQTEASEDVPIRQCLDAIVQIQNDLTNSTRFEERPTGSAHQLPRVPPTELIRGSWTQFITLWAVMLETLPPCEQLRHTLRSVMDAWFAAMAERQRDIYESGFSDMNHCAAAIQSLFNAHEKAVAATHAVLDGLKCRLGQRCHDELPNMIAMATREIIQGTIERTPKSDKCHSGLEKTM